MEPEASGNTAASPHRVHVFWAVGLTLLAVLGAACWFILVPILRMRSLTAEVARTGTVPEDAMERLGDRKHAARAIAIYLRSPRRLSPCRAEACYVLSHCGPHMIPVLRVALTDEDDRCRRVAARLADHIGASARPLAIELAAAASDSNPNVRINALKALGKIAPKGAEVAGLAWRAETAWRYSYDQLGRLKGMKQPSFPPFASEAAEEPADVNSQALGQIIGALARALDDSDLQVRNAALGSLRRYGTDAAPATGALVRGLGARADAIRVNAAGVLAQIGPGARDAVPALTKSMADPCADVRLNAGVALVRIMPHAPELKRLLDPLLKDAENGVAIV